MSVPQFAPVDAQVILMLVAAVEDAFEDVSLGTGVSLSEAMRKDGVMQAFRSEGRVEDECLDWHRIIIEDQGHQSDALSFMDAQGLKFHLPAFLMVLLETARHGAAPRLELGGVVGALRPGGGSVAAWSHARLSVFNAAQTRAICLVLQFIAEYATCSFDRADARKALKFWEPRSRHRP